MKFCSLASGSSGNSHYISYKNTGLLIDAGLSGKYIYNAVEKIGESVSEISGILVTHEHSDHIKGIGIVSRKLKIPVYMTEKTADAVRLQLKGGVPEIIIIEKDKPFNVGDLEIKAFGISHDAVDPVGYSISSGISKFSIATDLGIITDEIMTEISNSDLILIEANHDVEMLKMGKYPYYLKKRILSEHGHLSNDTAADAILNIVKNGKTRNVLLGHLSRENNFPQLALETVLSKLRENMIVPGVDVNIDMTYRDTVGNIYLIDN